jgi:hypothetical protein
MKQGTSVLRLLVFLFICGLLAGSALGQLDRGSITGTVKDATGAVLPGANVTVENQNTGVKTESITNDVGIYSFPNLPIGRYSVTYGMPGFKTLERTGITVGVGQSVRLDVVLELGEVSDLVTVAADAQLLTRDSSLVGTSIQSQIVTDLPLSFAGGRAVENFAYALTPGVEGNNWTSYIGGSPAFSKEVLIDGISATAQIQGHIGESSPTMEAVEEFRVQTSGMSAEYGRTSGGVFNFSLKSGTNQLRGSAFHYLRNEALNANSWMNNYRGVQKPRDRQALSGGSLGGPVVLPGIYDGRNRTFLFGAFEHYVQERLQLGPMNHTVPIPEFLNGDFSRLLTTEQVGTDALGRPVYAGQIFDPATMRQVEGRWVSDPFPGNIIPQNRMSAVSGKVIDIFRNHYQPMVPGVLTNNAARTLYNDPWFHQTQFTMKADHVITDNNRLSGSLIWTQRPRILVDAGGPWDPNDSRNTGGPLSRARKQEVTSRALRLSDNHTFRPNLMNTFSVAYNRYRNPSIATESEGGWSDFLGFGANTGAGNFPQIGFGSAVNGVGTEQIGYNASNYYVANTYIVNNTLGWITGRHSFKFGGEVWAQQINSHSDRDVLSFGFAPTQTGIPGEPWSNRIGFGFSSFYLGEMASNSKNVTFDLYGRRNYVSWFVQDDVKVNTRLTVNLGVRWDQAQPYREKHGRWANFSPDVTNTNLNMPGALEFLASPKDSFEKNQTWSQFAPRLGAAYQLTDKAVLRGGYGVFYIPTGINYWAGVPYGFAPGFRGTNFVSGTGNVPRGNWDAGFIDNYQDPNRDPNTLIWGMVAIDPDALKLGYTHQYNASLQYAFTTDTMVEATFMGTQGRRLTNGSLRRNQPTRAAYEAPGVNPHAWVWDADSAAAAGVPYPYEGFSGNAGFALMPYPHVMATTWGPVYYVGSPLGESAYRSMQLTLTRRMAGGVAAQMSYNLSRAVGNSETNFDETWSATAGIQDMYNLKEDARTILPYDRTHIFKGQVTYSLPFGRGRQFMNEVPGVVDAILGGWNLSTIFRYDTGEPLAISPNVSRPGWEGAVYADYNPNADFSRKFDTKNFNPGVQNDPGNRYFDASAFSNPTGNNMGNGKRRYEELRGFGRMTEDIGLLKYMSFTETAKLQIRAELVNAFNRRYFSNPGTGLGNLNTFGNVTSTTGSGRVVQVGLRLEF